MVNTEYRAGEPVLLSLSARMCDADRAMASPGKPWLSISMDVTVTGPW